MTSEQIAAIFPWVAVIIVFVGMAYIQLRFFDFTLKIAALQHPATAAPVAPPSVPGPSLTDLLAKLKLPAAAPTPTPTPAPAQPGAPTWYTLGLKDVGFHEVGDNRGIETFIAQAHVGSLGDPWCAIWANAKLEQAGVQGTRSASSQSFAHSADFVQLAAPALGCIVVFWRGTRGSGLGHVGFYVSETGTSINTLGGNESDAVRIEALPKDSANFGLVGYYWPKAVALPQSGAIAAPSTSLTHVVNAPVMTTPATGTVTGKMSTFGGPQDTGVSASEGLALCEPSEVGKFDGYFLPAQPPGTTGLARRLDPNSHYIAMRWDYKQTSRSYLQGITVKVAANGKTLDARPIDWGPNANTGRICDMSPGLAQALGLQTDNTCTVTVPTPAIPAVT